MKRLSAICLTALLMSSGAAFAQAGEATPRTSYGKPDFQGVWTNASITRLERVPEFKDLVISDADAKQWEKDAASVGAADSAPTDLSKGAPAAGEDPAGYNFFWIDPGRQVGKVNGTYRSSWITDPPNGKVPYTQAGRVAMMKPVATFNKYDNPEERIPIERCLIGFASTGGPPMLNALYNNHQQIIQTPDTIAINIEMVHDTRIIRMNGKHNPDNMRQYLGTSVGKWDGDTLIVETKGFMPMEAVRVDFGLFVYISPDSKVTERFTFANKDEIHYQFTVEDPVAYTQPWKGELTFRRSPDRIYEYACHEGNYSVPNILGGAREMEREGRKQPVITSGIGRLDRPTPQNTPRQ
ncbi:MAG: hypothetical protein Q8R02_07130 [Hyphomonadaceae bacterium]|nr:hypothetical protein [Hyphomonadaceae bacterium]